MLGVEGGDEARDRVLGKYPYPVG
jgi:hypothetical protein